VPGIDGRNNKGSAAVLKYLLMGSIGKDLVDASLDGAVEEALSEIVVLILESSVSVFWTRKARELIGPPLLLACPMLVEYVSAVEDDVDLDVLQESKCREFKRMILESVPAGEAIGVTLPMGYDEMEEVEGWPLLQAFALDENICSTGFLSMRYTLVDITENIDVIIKSVDGFVLENAIDTVTKSILPHVHQMLNILDTRSADQRVRLSMEDCLAPLDILFDFGEIAAGFPVDPELRCTALPGSHSKYFGLGFSKFETLAGITIGDSPHMILEGCEPSTGMRFCRTYFMSTGRPLPMQRDPESLTDDEANYEVAPKKDEATARLKALYFKLVCTLRWAVRATMAVHSDLFDVANAITAMTDAVMKGKESTAVFGDDAMRHDLDGLRVSSENGEEIKIHVDCMNAFGQVVSIDDVDDMGGQCFVFIRLTLHNIPLDNTGACGVIGVGDTFIYSPGYAPLYRGLASVSETMRASSVIPLTQDNIALTAAVPYHRFFVSIGKEEKSALLLLSNIRNAHMLPILGLEGAIETSSGSRGGLVVPMHVLTDNAFVPLAHADVKAFQEGFVIDRLNTRSLPALVSFKLHVEEAWSCDVTECHRYSKELWAKDNKGQGQPVCDELPSGILLVLKMKEGPSNPLVAALPTLGNCQRYPNQHVAFFVATDRSQDGMNGILGTWRRAMRMHDIVEHRGSSLKNKPIPQSILRSFVDSLGFWSMSRGNPFSGVKAMPGMLSVSDSKVEPISSMVSELSASDSWQIACDTGLGKGNVGTGYIPMVTTFSVAEARRLQLKSSYSDETTATEANDISSIGAGVSIVLLVGHTGSGILAVGSQVQQRINRNSVSGDVTELSFLNLGDGERSRGQHDKANVEASIFGFGGAKSESKEDGKEEDYSRSATLKALSSCLKKKPKQLILCVLLSCTNRVEPSSLYNLVSSTGATVSIIASVISAKATMAPFQNDQTVASSLGLEAWKASCLEVCHWGLCDYVLVIDEDDKSSAGNASAYADVCDWVTRANPIISNDNIHRLASGNTWLDSELVDAIVKSLDLRGSPLDLTRQSRAARNLRGVCQPAGAESVQALTRRTSAKSILTGVHNISSVRVDSCASVLDMQSVDSLSDLWDLELLTQFLRWLFPRATLNTSTTIGSKDKAGLGYVRGKKQIGSWRRATDLAVFQAVAGLRDKLGSSRLRDMLKKYCADDYGVLSVHGVIRINRGVMHGGSNAQSCFEVVSIEACAGSITVRPYSLDVSSSDMDSIVYTGLIDEAHAKSLRDLASSCTIYEIPRTRDCTRSDLSEKVLIGLQRRAKNHAKPLPNGWWFDGSAYFDVYGNRRVLRPDIEDMARDHILTTNEDVDRYNALLEKGGMMLLKSL
jgi:hypothetical protein